MVEGAVDIGWDIKRLKDHRLRVVALPQPQHQYSIDQQGITMSATSRIFAQGLSITLLAKGGNRLWSRTKWICTREEAELRWAKQRSSERMCGYRPMSSTWRRRQPRRKRSWSYALTEIQTPEGWQSLTPTTGRHMANCTSRLRFRNPVVKLPGWPKIPS